MQIAFVMHMCRCQPSPKPQGCQSLGGVSARESLALVRLFVAGYFVRYYFSNITFNFPCTRCGMFAAVIS